jgi:hypothetical protein
VIKDRTSYNEEREVTSSTAKQKKPPSDEERRRQEFEAKRREDLKLWKMCLKGAAVAVLVWILLQMSHNGRELASICSQYRSKVDTHMHHCRIDDMEMLCRDHSFSFVWRSIVCLSFAAAIIALDYVFDKYVDLSRMLHLQN